MKEYKVVEPKKGLRNYNERFEDLLNQYAREGWTVCQIMTYNTIVFERDKNR